MPLSTNCEKTGSTTPADCQKRQAILCLVPGISADDAVACMKKRMPEGISIVNLSDVPVSDQQAEEFLQDVDPPFAPVVAYQSFRNSWPERQYIAVTSSKASSALPPVFYLLKDNAYGFLRSRSIEGNDWHVVALEIFQNLTFESAEFITNAFILIANPIPSKPSCQLSQSKTWETGYIREAYSRSADERSKPLHVRNRF